MTKTALVTFVNEAIKGASEYYYSIHLDEIEDYYRVMNESISVLNHAISIMKETRNILEKSLDNVDHIITIYLPLGISEDVAIWEERLWDVVGNTKEPPSLYIIKGKEIFDENCEEYRRPLVSDHRYTENFKAVFRSFRPKEGIENNWEFSNGIYLIG